MPIRSASSPTNRRPNVKPPQYDPARAVIPSLEQLRDTSVLGGSWQSGVDGSGQERTVPGLCPAWYVDTRPHDCVRHEPQTHTIGPGAACSSAGRCARGARRGPVHHHGRHLDRERRAAAHPRRNGPVGQRNHLGGQRLQPGVRCPASGGRAGGRPPRPPPDTDRRPRAVRGLLAGGRTGRLLRRADRRPSRPGSRRRRHRPGRARPGHGAVPVRAGAGQSTGGVGRGLRRGRSVRCPAGWCSHTGMGLALDLPLRRPRGRTGAGRRGGPRTTGGRPEVRAVRSAGHCHGQFCPDLPGLGADHRTRHRLDGHPCAGRPSRRRRAARSLRRDRTSPAERAGAAAAGRTAGPLLPSAPPPRCSGPSP